MPKCNECGLKSALFSGYSDRSGNICKFCNKESKKKIMRDIHLKGRNPIKKLYRLNQLVFNNRFSSEETEGFIKLVLSKYKH